MKRKITRRNFLMTAVPVCAFPTLPSLSLSAPSTRPNIILVFIDDMGWADLSCFGNKEASTPNIDRMAAEGIAFDQFYVNAPICSPSRVAISTGQYPQRWKITSYLDNRKRNAQRGMANWLDPEAPMLARSLKEAGYATGHFGKWHMGGQRDVAEAPLITEYGFDESLTNFEGMGPKLLPLTMEPGWTEPRKIWADAERLGGPFKWVQRSAITGGFVDAAMDFIRKAASGRNPFYINLWPDDVHSPYFPPIEKWGRNKRELYLAVLGEMDRQMGPLFDYIRSHKDLRNNTVIIICSDNGYEPGAGSAGILKGCKTNLFEGGIRSSLVIWGPGVMPGEAIGTRNKSSVMAAIDIAPSLLRLAGIVPRPGSLYDGEDVLDTMLGRSRSSRQAPIFFSRPPDRKSFHEFRDLPDLAVRHGKWKLLCDYDGGRPQLYDISTDPGETANLAEKEPDVTKEWTGKLIDWHQSMTSNK